jgi:Skp family chaperone for outer membrane proteins
MRKLVVFLCVVGVRVAYPSAPDSGKAKAPLVSVSSAPWKIAVVHLGRIKDGYSAVNALNENLKQNIEAAQKELLLQASDFEKTEKEYRELADKAANPALTAEARKELKEKADAALLALQYKGSTVQNLKTIFEDRVSKMGSEGSLKILKTIRQKTEEVAKEQGFSIALDADSPVVFCAVGCPDITDPVIEALNADWSKSAAPAAPAATQPKQAAVTSAAPAVAPAKK